MQVNVDEPKLAGKINSMIDVPYLPESVEAQAINAAVAALAKALANIAAGNESVADYGVTVTA